MSYVYLGRSLNMENYLKEELGRRRRAAWAVFGPLRGATEQLIDHELRAHLFDSTVLPALYYAAETWSDTASSFPAERSAGNESKFLTASSTMLLMTMARERIEWKRCWARTTSEDGPSKYLSKLV
ncbi:hypothetical protein Y032_0146g2539 [Ancylostoma ceylanicum]|uniref:Uncharacterized protein n=1 Tax=Ancylostoma ceylanicum TaxID=53326 RepID=A0A016T2E3_9BILA|nr:hypothetical protein Y032_0146g2539 [Ancylostoma ceylanicum]